LSNKCIINSCFWEKPLPSKKRRRFYRWAWYYFFTFLWFGNVSWNTNMKPYVHWKYVHYILYANWFY
jgi:hypothetical protein